MSELSGRTAIVTGATRGIGRGVALRLAAAGAYVVGTGRDGQAGRSLAGEIKSQGGDGEFFKQDVTDAADWQRLAEHVWTTRGRLDVMVANAGVTSNKPAVEMSLEEFRALNNVNLKGVFSALRMATEIMRRTGDGGSIVLVGSIVGKVGVAGYTHYSAAKDGVRLMAKAAALELGPENIRVNSLHPGMVRTDMTAGFPEEQMGAVIPLGRFGDPAEMAEAVAFLASPRSAYMTGAELVADGGWIAQ